jgi:hypothetical protein
MTLREAFFWALLSACALMFFITGCMDRHLYKPAHVPRVRYNATFEDKDCKRSADGLGWDCNHVHLNPLEIDATGAK